MCKATNMREEFIPVLKDALMWMGYRAESRERLKNCNDARERVEKLLKKLEG